MASRHDRNRSVFWQLKSSQWWIVFAFYYAAPLSNNHINKLQNLCPPRDLDMLSQRQEIDLHFNLVGSHSLIEHYLTQKLVMAKETSSAPLISPPPPMTAPLFPLYGMTVFFEELISPDSVSQWRSLRSAFALCMYIKTGTFLPLDCAYVWGVHWIYLWEQQMPLSPCYFSCDCLQCFQHITSY